MLVISRRQSEMILIEPAEGVDDTLPLRDLFAECAIEIMLVGTTGKRFKMGVSAPRELSIRRKDE